MTGGHTRRAVLPAVRLGDEAGAKNGRVLYVRKWRLALRVQLVAFSFHGWGSPAGRVDTCLPALYSRCREPGVG